ncbi:hypothetical protein [Acetobacterium bakii]|nr:hypothetical protein [Acetobacterium bakii]
MSASWRTGFACPIMQPTTIYHCPQDEFVNELRRQWKLAFFFIR